MRMVTRSPPRMTTMTPISMVQDGMCYDRRTGSFHASIPESRIRISKGLAYRHAMKSTSNEMKEIESFKLRGKPKSIGSRDYFEPLLPWSAPFCTQVPLSILKQGKTAPCQFPETDKLPEVLSVMRINAKKLYFGGYNFYPTTATKCERSTQRSGDDDKQIQSFLLSAQRSHRNEADQNKEPESLINFGTQIDDVDDTLRVKKLLSTLKSHLEDSKKSSLRRMSNTQLPLYSRQYWTSSSIEAIAKQRSNDAAGVVPLSYDQDTKGISNPFEVQGCDTETFAKQQLEEQYDEQESIGWDVMEKQVIVSDKEEAENIRIVSQSNEYPVSNYVDSVLCLQDLDASPEGDQNKDSLNQDILNVPDPPNSNATFTASYSDTQRGCIDDLIHKTNSRAQSTGDIEVEPPSNQTSPKKSIDHMPSTMNRSSDDVRQVQQLAEINDSKVSIQKNHNEQTAQRKEADSCLKYQDDADEVGARLCTNTPTSFCSNEELAKLSDSPQLNEQDTEGYKTEPFETLNICTEDTDTSVQSTECSETMKNRDDILEEQVIMHVSVEHREKNPFFNEHEMTSLNENADITSAYTQRFIGLDDDSIPCEDLRYLGLDEESDDDEKKDSASLDTLAYFADESNADVASQITCGSFVASSFPDLPQPKGRPCYFVPNIDTRYNRWQQKKVKKIKKAGLNQAKPRGTSDESSTTIDSDTSTTAEEANQYITHNLKGKELSATPKQYFLPFLNIDKVTLYERSEVCSESCSDRNQRNTDDNINRCMPTDEVTSTMLAPQPYHVAEFEQSPSLLPPKPLETDAGVSAHLARPVCGTRSDVQMHNNTLFIKSSLKDRASKIEKKSVECTLVSSDALSLKHLKSSSHHGPMSDTCNSTKPTNAPKREYLPLLKEHWSSLQKNEYSICPSQQILPEFRVKSGSTRKNRSNIIVDTLPRLDMESASVLAEVLDAPKTIPRVTQDILNNKQCKVIEHYLSMTSKMSSKPCCTLDGKEDKEKSFTLGELLQTISRAISTPECPTSEICINKMATDEETAHERTLSLFGSKLNKASQLYERHETNHVEESSSLNLVSPRSTFPRPGFQQNQMSNEALPVVDHPSRKKKVRG